MRAAMSISPWAFGQEYKISYLAVKDIFGRNIGRLEAERPFTRCVSLATG